MPTVVGVKLRLAPKVAFFNPAGTDPQPGEEVIVQTDRGVEIGQVAEAAHEVDKAALPSTLPSVVRVATAEDLASAKELLGREKEALATFRSLIEDAKLDMKPVDVEFLFGGDKAVFYFVAEERVDFRELVRGLASRYKMRIDMRQVGVRDEARMVGGLGHCGQVLCCVRFAGDFQPVSIRMAKEQDLPLNPLKISGLCGRLMCCLRYEYEAYKDFKQRAPKKGARVETPVGEGKVSGFSTPREVVMVKLAEGGSLKIPLAAMECPGGGCPCTVSAEALDALKSERAEAALAGPVRLLTESTPEPPRSSGGESRRASGSGSGTKAEGGQQDAAGGRGRRRRKPRGGSGAEGAAAGGAAKAAPATGGAKSAPKQSDGGAGPAAAEKSSGAGTGGRRRRRKRPAGPKSDDTAGE